MTLKEALVLVEHDGLSLAILDHALGDGDSTRLCERLRERGIPFLIYSGLLPKSRRPISPRSLGTGNDNLGILSGETAVHSLTGKTGSRSDPDSAAAPPARKPRRRSGARSQRCPTARPTFIYPCLPVLGRTHP